MRKVNELEELKRIVVSEYAGKESSNKLIKIIDAAISKMNTASPSH